jgi:hypothetical protein
MGDSVGKPVELAEAEAAFLPWENDRGGVRLEPGHLGEMGGDVGKIVSIHSAMSG